MTSSKVFLTADWHLGEDRFKLMGRQYKGRQFSSQEEMVDTFVNNHNLVVSPEDKVIVIGDVCRNATPDWLPHVARFNGRKTLIRGNHDQPISDEQFGEYFETIIAEGDGLDITIDGLDCYCTHYPTRGAKDKFNLVGHIHGIWKYQLNMFNVGVDVNGYCPVPLTDIPFHYQAICKFYDDDAWASYSEINKQYIGFRGVKGSYFK